MRDIFEIGTPKRGAAPLFKPYHVLQAMYRVREEGAVGRKVLADLVGIGEGSARGLCEHLEGHGLAKQTSGGIRLSRRGDGYLEKIGLACAKLDASKLTTKPWIRTYTFALPWNFT